MTNPSIPASARPSLLTFHPRRHLPLPVTRPAAPPVSRHFPVLWRGLRVFLVVLPIVLVVNLKHVFTQSTVNTCLDILYNVWMSLD